MNMDSLNHHLLLINILNKNFILNQKIKDMNKKQSLAYLDNNLIARRTVCLKDGNRLKGLSLDNAIKTVSVFFNNYEKDEDDIDIEKLKLIIASKGKNCDIQADVFMEMDHEVLMEKELRDAETFKSIEKELDKFLKK